MVGALQLQKLKAGLRRFPTEGVQVLQGRRKCGNSRYRENLAVVMKVESHNHPSAVDISWAATGVGGIIRTFLRWDQDLWHY